MSKNEPNYVFSDLKSVLNLTPVRAFKNRDFIDPSSGTWGPMSHASSEPQVWPQENLNGYVRHVFESQHHDLSTGGVGEHSSRSFLY